jgi:GNAT superfamily N-acetyltransferase
MHAAPVHFPFMAVDPKTQYAEELADPAHRIWLAYSSGHAIGYIGAGPIKHDAGFMLQDVKTAGITGAFVEQEHRSKGFAGALLQAAVNWVRDTGYERLAVDFEPENTVASRFWCRHFGVTGLSFGRLINVKQM